MKIPENDNRRYIHISPSSSDDLQFCRRFYRWREWVLPSKAVRLDEGLVMHKILEFYYKLRAIAIPVEDAKELAIEEARKFYLQDDAVDTSIIERMIEIFREYVGNYGESDWQVYMHDGKPAVEIPSSVVLYENDKIVVLFELITDLIVVERGEIIPVDHKTREQNRKPTYLTNQFMGTLWALKADRMIYNAIGTQKNEPAGGRFERIPISFSQSVLDEWRETMIYWVFRLLQAEETGYWDANHKACWSCVFKEICTYPAETREPLIAQQFVKRAPRDLYVHDVKVTP